MDRDALGCRWWPGCRYVAPPYSICKVTLISDWMGVNLAGWLIGDPLHPGTPTWQVVVAEGSCRDHHHQEDGRLALASREEERTVRDEYHPPVEEYLQTIESLTEEGEPVIAGQGRRAVGKSAPSVSEMLDRLEVQRVRRPGGPGDQPHRQRSGRGHQCHPQAPAGRAVAG